MEAKTKRLKNKIERLQQQRRELDEMREHLETLPDAQVSLTDPNARSITSHGKGTGTVGYNVQAAVDAKHDLIVAHEVTNVGNDRAQLAPMVEQARDAIGSKKLHVLADRGYYNAQQIKACADAGIAVMLPKPMTSNAKAEGRFDKSLLHLHRPRRIPVPGRSAGSLPLRSRGERSSHPAVLEQRLSAVLHQRQVHVELLSAHLRWEHEPVLEATQRRLDRRSDAMTIRRSTVEHVFGTLKHWMCSTHFLMRTLPNVATEMSLYMLAYNLKRVLALIGPQRMLRAINSQRA